MKFWYFLFLIGSKGISAFYQSVKAGYAASHAFLSDCSYYALSVSRGLANDKNNSPGGARQN
jgi:hypothetical protein